MMMMSTLYTLMMGAYWRSSNEMMMMSTLYTLMMGEEAAMR
jgi:hypothetical protein